MAHVIHMSLDTLIVTAAHHWDDDPDLMTIRAPMKGSLEDLIDHSTDRDAFIITHSIRDTQDGRSKKVEESYELTEYACGQP